MRASQCAKSPRPWASAGKRPANISPIPTPNGPLAQTTPEENRAIVARYFDEVMNEGDFGVIDQIIAPNFAFRIPTLPEPIRGPDGFRAFVTGLRDAFPDIHFTVEREWCARLLT